MEIQNRYRLLGSAVRTAGSENLSIKARLKSIAKSINDFFAAESTSVYILDEEGRYLSKKITHENHDEILSCSIPLHEGAAGACAADKSLTQKGKEDLFHDELVKGTEREMLCVPVPPGKRVKGVISIGSRERLMISREETELLRDISAVVGNLIHSEEIVERSGKRVRNLVTLNELGKTVNRPYPYKTLPSFLLKTCHDLTDSCCTILRISGYGGLLSGLQRKYRKDFRASLPSLLELEEQYAQRVSSTGTAILITDLIAEGMLQPPSCVCVPLYNESKVAGTLTFFGKREEDGRFVNFDEEDRELFEGMAAPVSAALEVAANNRQTELLASENERKFRELSLLYRISNAMHSTIKLNEMISLALNVLVSGAVPIFERTMLFLVNERAGVIQGMMGVTHNSSRNFIAPGEEEGNPLNARWEFSGEDLAGQTDSEFSRKVKEARMPLDKSLNISSRAILEKKLFHVNDAAKEKRVDQDFVKRFCITEFAALPLMAKDEVVGLVIVDNPLTGKGITRGDLRFLQLLLNQTGIAIENSMLYSRIEDAHRDFREVQQRLIQGEKLAAIGEMAASIAHELKGPLVSIGGLAKRMERKLPTDSSEWKYAETIAREAARLEKMLTDTLLFSKKAAICCVSCNINVIIEESLAMVSRQLEEKNIKVRLRSHPDVGPFTGDFLQLKQVFINLFSNAADAMKNGGTLSISIAPARLDGADALYVKVLDTGGGIPLEILNNIFNPFFTTKDYGTGLGLPISHAIVSNHGGKILVYNRVGVGAQFKVVLPVNPPKE